MKKFEKAFAISVLSGICCFSTQATEEAKAIFNKKPKLPPTSIPGVRSSKIMGTGPGGFTIREVKGVLQDGNSEIAERNMLLASIKTEIGVSRTGAERKELFTKKAWELVQYEPDTYKRDFKKRFRSHTHIDNKNDIQVKVNINLGNGELENMIVKTGGKRHFINVKTGDYDVTDIASKTQTSSTDKSADLKPQVLSTDKSGEEVGTSIQSKPSDSKIKDARPKTQVSSTSESEGDGKNVNKKTYSPQVESQQLIDNIYKTKGLNIELLDEAIKNYSGDVQEVDSEKFYRFSGDKGNYMTISVLKNGELSEVSINNKGSKFERAYDEDFWETNLGSSLKDVKIEYTPQAESQKLIDDVYTTKGLDKRLLYKAIRDYTGDVEINKLEDIYRFLGDNNNSLEMYMDKHGEITGILIKNGNEIFEKSYGDDGVGDLVFYKTGYFEVPGSKAVIEKPIYKNIDEKGQVYYLAEEKDGTFTKVLERSGDMFVNVLSRKDASIYGKIREQKIVEAKNKYGENKRVILESIILNGEKKTVAYQLDDGAWREVTVSDTGVLWLGDVVKYENLLSEVAGKLRKLARLYARFGAPFVGGATGVSKFLSGFMK